MTTVIKTADEYVFFDVDDTLIALKSMLSFQSFWYQNTGDTEGQAAYEDDLRRHWQPDACWAFLNRLYYRHYRGRDPKEVSRLGRAWFQRMRGAHPAFYHPRPVAELREHQRAGRTVVFVSGSFPALLESIAEELQVRYVLSTRLEVRNGVYTGELLPPQTIGEGKVRAMAQFLGERGGLAERCFAYGDDISDLAMLEAVGRPTVVRGGRALEAQAERRGWRVIAPD